jgi:uncharacterized protein with PIN domain
MVIDASALVACLLDDPELVRFIDAINADPGWSPSSASSRRHSSFWAARAKLGSRIFSASSPTRRSSACRSMLIRPI